MQQLVPVSILLAVALSGCAKKQAAPAYDGEDLPPDVAGNTSPTSETAAVNAAVRQDLPLSDPQDFEDAKRGLVASDPELRVTKEEGKTIWSVAAYDFVKGDAPVSVNPSLWRQAQLNNIHGLFEVTQGVYQIRGYDLANMSLIEGKTGWIVVDPLTAKETGAKAMAFAREHLGDKPVSAVIYTHSHIDHFGGVLGVISAEEVAERNVPIIAPEFFLEEATSENVIAGAAMARRSMFMMGPRLPKGERGHVDTGLGKGVAYGTFGLIPPSAIVTETGTEMTIDGVRFIFQNAPGSEAPSEMTFYLPDLKTFCGAEVVSHTMHNLYTLRGAKVLSNGAAISTRSSSCSPMSKCTLAATIGRSGAMTASSTSSKSSAILTSTSTTKPCGSRCTVPRRGKSQRSSVCRSRYAPRSQIAATTERSSTM